MRPLLREDTQVQGPARLPRTPGRAHASSTGHMAREIPRPERIRSQGACQEEGAATHVSQMGTWRCQGWRPAPAHETGGGQDATQPPESGSRICVSSHGIILPSERRALFFYHGILEVGSSNQNSTRCAHVPWERRARRGRTEEKHQRRGALSLASSFGKVTRETKDLRLVPSLNKQLVNAVLA